MRINPEGVCDPAFIIAQSQYNDLRMLMAWHMAEAENSNRLGDQWRNEAAHGAVFRVGANIRRYDKVRDFHARAVKTLGVLFENEQETDKRSGT